MSVNIAIRDEIEVVEVTDEALQQQLAILGEMTWGGFRARVYVAMPLRFSVLACSSWTILYLRH